jgi:hypothetical protein
MQFDEVTKARRSVRKYSTTVAGGFAAADPGGGESRASAGNAGLQVFLARSNAARVALAHAANGQDFIEQAPIALVFCPRRDRPRAMDGAARSCTPSKMHHCLHLRDAGRTDAGRRACG